MIASDKSFAIAVSVMLPTSRRYDAVLNTVRDVFAQDYPNFEIIVGDQNEQWPQDLVESKNSLAADDRVRWLKTAARGVSAARNELVRCSRGEILLFIDDDIAIPDRDFIARHVENYRDLSISAVVGREMAPGDEPFARQPTIEASPTPPRASSPLLDDVLNFNRNSSARREACAFCTCNSSMRREAYLGLAGFDERLGASSYGDDYDLALRLYARGGRIVYDPTARVVHLKAPVGGLRMSDTGNPFSERERVLPGVVFFFRHGARRFR